MPYPSIVTSFTTPLASDRLNSPSHSSIEAAQNTGLTELQTFVGTLSSVAGTLMYDIRGANSNGGGHVQTANTGGTGQTVYAKGDILSGQSSSTLSKLAVGTDGQILTADSTKATGIRWGGGKFGGTGADGALNITTGTTTINLASVQTLVKNYTSIDITGTGKLAFSSPHTNGTVVILKSQGNVNITATGGSIISLVGMGAGVANPGYSFSTLKTFPGITTVGAGSGGDGGSIAGLSTPTMNTSVLVAKYANVLPGAGGASGGAQVGGNGGGGSFLNAGSPGGNGANTGSSGQGTGGRGGGGLIIECGGNWNFTSSGAGITAAGQNGSNGSGGGNAGGGGAGGGGAIIVAVGSVVANTGTLEATGGNGGVAIGSGGNGGAGGVGYTVLVTNNDFL